MAYQWYNNGKTNKKIYENQEPPLGYVKGYKLRKAKIRLKMLDEWYKNELQILEDKFEKRKRKLEDKLLERQKKVTLLS